MPEYKVESVRWLRSQAILRHRQQEFGERDIFNAIAKEIEDLKQKDTLTNLDQAQMIDDLNRARMQANLERDRMQQYFEDLRDLCGYIEDGSDTSITIGQDDATKDWFLIVKGGKQTLYSAPTFSGLIKSVHDHLHREKKDDKSSD